MIRHYTFNYNTYEAEACFKVDIEKLKAEDEKQAAINKAAAIARAKKK